MVALFLYWSAIAGTRSFAVAPEIYSKEIFWWGLLVGALLLFLPLFWMRWKLRLII